MKQSFEPFKPDMDNTGAGRLNRVLIIIELASFDFDFTALMIIMCGNFLFGGQNSKCNTEKPQP